MHILISNDDGYLAPGIRILAKYLASVVTPVAFGWSFPLQVELRHYFTLTALAVGSMTLAVVLPTLRLLRISPATMLRELTI